MSPESFDSEEQFRLIVEAAPNGMLLVDESGTIVMVNASVLRQFGYEREEVLGKSVEMLIPGPFRSDHRQHRAGFINAPQTRSMGGGRELFGLRKDGSEVPVEIGLTPIQTITGMGVLASILDISERKRLEMQLRRTERLAELGTLASGMAHEIGTPMNVILGRAEYLLQRTADEGMKKGLTTIVKQVERITKVMNQLLAFARRRMPERRAVDLGEIVDDSLEMFQERIVQSRITVDKTIESSLPPVRADRDQLIQVLINLVMNSIHAMPEGGRLRLSLARESSHVRLGLSDTGHGMPEEIRSKVFEPFFTTKDFGKGTGLGLTVVKGIIEEHGGTIDVESVVDKGTTFWIRLPLDKLRSRLFPKPTPTPSPQKFDCQAGSLLSRSATGAGCHLLQFSSGLGAFPSSVPASFRGNPSKLAQFWNPSLPAGEKVRLARVMHCVPLAGSGTPIVACENSRAHRS